jgi:23S rRNA (cytosine1962-C5)-methyltransferase
MLHNHSFMDHHGPKRHPSPSRRRTRVTRSSAAPPDAQSPWAQLRSATPHPFIFQRMLRAADPAARPGDVVTVYDKTGAFFGRGLFNPKSQIAIRMLAYGNTPIDESFWRGRFAQAVALRRTLELGKLTDAYRLVHSEGDNLSGLIVERYADCLVFEIFALGMFQRWPQFAALLADELGPPSSLDRPDKASPTWRTFVRADAQIEAIEGFQAAATQQDVPARLIIREHGIRYRVDIVGGHKTGFFCDQRDNRLRLARLCRGADVLDVCCYTGGFGLCAKVLGGATSVTGVDLDEAAVDLARENANLNQARLDLVHADAFAYMRQMQTNNRQFDVVVLDPPKLATSRRDLEEGLTKHHDLNALAIQLVRPGGLLLTCSCSGLVSREAFLAGIYAAGRRTGRNLQMFDFTGAAADHPIMLNCPESGYLKAVWLRLPA